VIDVQVRAHHDVDVLDGETGGGKIAVIPLRIHHVPERPARPWLVIADAGVDQDRVVPGLDQIALHAQDDLIVPVDETRLEPGFVLAQHLRRQRRKEFQRVEERRFLLDNAMNDGVARRKRDRHAVTASRKRISAA
jgi:hypothetical protein